jgi:hypothetical protein
MDNIHLTVHMHEQSATAKVKRGLAPRWLVSGRTSHGLAPVWRVWRIDELTERTDFLRSFRSLLPSSRFALSRLCPEVLKVGEVSSTSILQARPFAAFAAKRRAKYPCAYNQWECTAVPSSTTSGPTSFFHAHARYTLIDNPRHFHDLEYREVIAA